MSSPNKLPTPVRKILREHNDDISMQRAWKQIERARSLAAPRAPSRRLAVAAALLLALFATSSFAMKTWRAWRASEAAQVKPRASQARPSVPVQAPSIAQTPIVDIADVVDVAAAPVTNERATPVAVVSPRVAHRAAPSSSWRSLAEQGAFREAYETLGQRGFEVASTQGTPEDLLALADVARLSGHPQDAIGPLERLLRDFATSSYASLAAISLGRIELDALHHPDRAAVALERALAFHPPAQLVEDVHARLVEAHARAGHLEEARRAAENYLALFPSGRRVDDVKRFGRIE